MIKEDINLLAPEVRKKRVRKVYSSRVSRLYNTILFGCAILLVIYGVSFWILHQSGAAFNQQLMTQEESGAVEGKIRTVNQRLGLIHQRVIAHLPWSKHIQQVIKALPQGVVISSMHVEESTGILTITGTSSERTAVLAFEDKIKSFDWAETVDAPLQNFASGERAEFNITVQRKKLTIADKL